jgi:RNA polymerase sigma-70 factor, ECF subfamily
MGLLSARESSPPGATPRPEPCAESGATLDFEAVYEENFRFVWRATRRLGIDAGDIDDVVQEVFVVAHRKLSGFEGRSQLKTWLFKILVRVVRHHFRARARKPGHRVANSFEDLDALVDHRTRGPAEAVERADAVRVLDAILARLDSDKREVFVLAEIEQLTSVEIADVLGANINTIYSRLRVARQEFERAVARFQTHELGGEP